MEMAKIDCGPDIASKVSKEKKKKIFEQAQNKIFSQILIWLAIDTLLKMCILVCF